MQKFSNINKMSISSISSFMNINGRFDGVVKDTYFLRYIGYDDEKFYIEEILNADIFMKDKINSKVAGYYRTSRLGNISIEDKKKYEQIYQNYMTTEKLENLKFDILQIMDSNIHSRFNYILKISQDYNFTNKNILGVKILYWIDLYFSKLFLQKFNYKISPKFIFTGYTDIDEYLFFYFLVLNGCDVLLVNTFSDLKLNQELLSLSRCFKFNNLKQINIPEFKAQESDICRQNIAQINSSDTIQINPTNGNLKIKLDLKRPDRQKSKIINNQNISNDTKSQDKFNIANNSNTQINIFEKEKQYEINTEKPKKTYVRKLHDYEELARLATSVVMIEAYDNSNKIMHCGSGVMIGKNGYIITNYHVIANVFRFGVRIENDDNIYMTNSILKYHKNFDLAIIKIDRKLKPMRLYREKEKLVRGQKVLAIGSQLGMFNSISDGIIGGFRNFEDDMTVIQFTAPTLGGNSGGALLNMYGELIGIIFAGMSENLNLAIDYETIYMFARGFLDE